MGLKPNMASVLIGRGKCGNRDAHGECLVKTEVETGVMRLQAKECQGAPRIVGTYQNTEQRPLTDASLTPSEGAQSC